MSNNNKMATNNKPAQILQLTPPSEIVFNGPFDRVVTSYLELHNPYFNTICFKVKTTAPRRYCVRPNSGTVAPGCKIRVAIMLQPMEDETPNERVRHKFMVQSTVLLQDVKNLDSVWLDLSPDQIMDSKLRCVFESPEKNDAESKTTTPATNTTVIPEAASTTTSSSTTDASPASKTLPSTNSITQQSSSTLQQQKQTIDSQKSQQTAGDGQNTSKSKETKSFASTPIASRIHTIRKSDSSEANRSVASSSNLTSSFLQPMSDDYKIVLVSLIMLFVGVILGKYII